jgi:hypothetical protein
MRYRLPMHLLSDHATGLLTCYYFLDLVYLIAPLATGRNNGVTVSESVATSSCRLSL